jgi:hypothetical protein
MTDFSKQLRFIAGCNDEKQLRALINNAKAQGAGAVSEAAFRKLISIVPGERPGTVEHDFWQTLFAFEHILSDERGKTTRLSRTRQKVGRVGVVKILADWAVGATDSDGFKMLLERKLPELTGEAIVLRHPDSFDEETRAAAARRLTKAGVDVVAMRPGQDG